jgi:thiosulfate/3-mercaptopyruvate sulfurtransferase
MQASPQLIAPESLARLDSPVILDCRFDLADPGKGRRLYAEGHLPGAGFADLDLDLSGPIGPRTGRHPLPDPAALACRLGDWGVDADTSVVVYDDLGGAFAARLWWLLRWLGHPNVRLLDGGIQAWSAAGGALTIEAPVREPRDFVPRIDTDAWVSTPNLVRLLASERIQVIDARAAARFRGESEPIDPVAGHIPGAINLPLQGNLGEGGRFLPAPLLRERFLTAIGTRDPREIAHSCGSGVNACHNLLAMEVAGLGGSRLYAGSWSEWIRSPERPVAVGDEQANRRRA